MRKCPFSFNEVAEHRHAEHVNPRWRERYIPSQQFYFATVRPTDHADMIVRNDEPQQPVRETQTPQPGIG